MNSRADLYSARYVDQRPPLRADLAFIQSEEFVKKFPDSQETPAHIEIMFASPPSPDGVRFLNGAREMIGQAGWSLSWQVIRSPFD